MRAPNYRWVCFFCSRVNPENVQPCTFCGKNANASGKEIEEARAAAAAGAGAPPPLAPALTPKACWYALVMERFAVACVLFGVYQLLSLIVKSIPSAGAIAVKVAESPNTPQTVFGVAAMAIVVLAIGVLYSYFKPSASSARRAMQALMVDFLGQVGDATFITAWFFFANKRWDVTGALLITGSVAIGLVFFLKEKWES